MLANRFGVGTRLAIGEAVHVVEAMRGNVVTLRDNRNVPAAYLTSALLDRDDVRFLEPEVDYHVEPYTDYDLIDACPPDVAEQARLLRDHLRELYRGYRSGDPLHALPGEPRPEYDKTQTPREKDRVEHKSRELAEIGMPKAPSSLRNLWKAYNDQGLIALIDKRHVKAIGQIGTLDERLLRAADELFDELRLKSEISVANFCERLRLRVEQTHGAGVVPLPRSEGTLRGHMKTMGRPRGFFTGNARRRQQAAIRPETPYYRKLAERPGEFVLLDATKLDVFVMDDLTMRETRVDLLAAFDLYTRSFIGWRFTPTNTNRLDASLLLRDVLMPKPMRPGWPKEAAWNYHGVPEWVICDLCSAYGMTDAAGVPLVNPQNVIADNAWAYGSALFRESCERLGINLHLARPKRPTDKAHLERAFRTVRHDFVAFLDAYTGPNILERGVKPEGDAWLFLSELEEKFAWWVATYYQHMPHDGCRQAPLCQQELSPNRMFELGIARAGFLYAPPHQDLFYDLLPRVACTVQHYGVDAFGLTYDGSALDGYRGRRSNLGGRMKGKYPLAYDPRDLSVLYFRRQDGSWGRVPWIYKHRYPQAFSQAVIAELKRGLREDGITSAADRRRELAVRLREFLARNEADAQALLPQRRALSRALLASPGLDRDRATLTSVESTAVSADEPSDAEQLLADAGSGYDLLAGVIEDKPFALDDTDEPEDEHYGEDEPQARGAGSVALDGPELAPAPQAGADAADAELAAPDAEIDDSHHDEDEDDEAQSGTRRRFQDWGAIR